MARARMQLLTWSVAIFASALLGNLVLTVILALVLPLPEGQPMTPAQSGAFLEEAMGSWLEPDTVIVAEGTVSHRALERRVFVRGVLSDTGQTVVATHVLKIGWPFTTLRGFVHIRGKETMADGAIRIRGNPRVGFVRFIPLNPVWPGVIINTLMIAVAAGAGALMIRRRA